MAGGAGGAAPEPVTLHSSWRGIATAFGSPLVVLLLGVLAVLEGGPGAFSLAVVGVGLVLGAVSLWDFPLAATLGPRGVVRRCALRRAAVRWERVEALRRAPGPRLRRSVPGPLAAAAGRRRWLLVDQAESEAEYDAVVRGLVVWAPGVRVEAARPPADTPPTWLYRRRRSPAP